MTKKIQKITKALLIMAFALGMFTVNVSPVMMGHESIFSTRVFAETSNQDLLDASPLPPCVAGQPAPEGGCLDPTPGDPNDTQAGTALADEKSNQPKQPSQETLQTVAKAATYVNLVFTPMIVFITTKIGLLLNNDYIYGSEMGKMLKIIWVTCRNIVNIAFVLILLFLAIKHIYSSAGEENYLKKVLPTFIIWLVVVNFSWLATKVVLDAANVATNVMFSIPTATQGGFSFKECQISSDGGVIGDCAVSKTFLPPAPKTTFNYKDSDCTTIGADYDKVFPKDSSGKELPPTPAAELTDQQLVYKKSASICWQNMDMSKFDHNSASLFLTFNMARVQNLIQNTTPAANDPTIGTLDGITKVTVNTLFAFIFQIIYLIAFGALFVALIIRVLALWFLVAFSPFLVLIKAAEKLELGGGKMENEYLSVDAFISWAFAPVFVAAVWSIGFIMITAGQTVNTNFFEAIGSGVTAKTYGYGSLFAGMPTIQQLVWFIMTTALIWIGTFTALKTMKPLAGVAEKVSGWGTKLATGAAEAAAVAPLVPLGLAKAPGAIKNLANAPGEWASKKMGLNVSDTNKINDGMSKLKSISSETKKTINEASTENKVKLILENSHLSNTDLHSAITADKESVKKGLQEAGIDIEHFEDIVKEVAKADKKTDTKPATGTDTPKEGH